MMNNPIMKCYRKLEIGMILEPNKTPEFEGANDTEGKLCKTACKILREATVKEYIRQFIDNKIKMNSYTKRNLYNEGIYYYEVQMD